MSASLTDEAKNKVKGEFRFSIIGGLLASPPEFGELKKELEYLSKKYWCHPLTKRLVQYHCSTLERWFYDARGAADPVQKLSTIPRSDKGRRVLSQNIKSLLHEQYLKHQDWTCTLHLDNLKASLNETPELGPCPSYMTVLRYMKAHGMRRQKKVKKDTPGRQLARDRLESREVRSFEMEFVASLWHLDYHHGSRRVLLESGQWITPICLAIHDDHSRLCCHIQWYERETCENLVHGLSQAFLKRGLPRSLMTDNGAAMKADEFIQGLSRLGVIHDPSLPYSPYQNGKTERFWGVLESRLMPMIPDGKDLTMDTLNQSTISWAEMGYNRDINRDMKNSPIGRIQSSKDVSRIAPNPMEIKLAFRSRIKRRQRRSDGTITINGSRYEIPNHWRHAETLYIHVAKWDMNIAHIVEKDTDQLLARIWPMDRLKNSSGLRKPMTTEISYPLCIDSEPAPLLKHYLAEFASTGMPFPYLPKTEHSEG